MEPITQNMVKEFSADEKQKLELIQDIINAKKLLFGFGFSSHIDALTSPGDIFDDLYDKNTEMLTITWSYLQAEVSCQARLLAGL